MSDSNGDCGGGDSGGGGYDSSCVPHDSSYHHDSHHDDYSHGDSSSHNTEYFHYTGQDSFNDAGSIHSNMPRWKSTEKYEMNDKTKKAEVQHHNCCCTLI